MINFFITYWFEVLLFIVAAVPSIILIAIKGRIAHWFAKDLKKYEQQLDLLKMQKQLQFSNVYTKRAEIIAKIYENITRIAMADIILQAAKFKDQEALDRDLRDFASHIFESQVYFAINGIYLNEGVRVKLRKLHDQVSKELISNMSDTADFINEDTLKDIMNSEEINKDEILGELIAEFQDILGVDDNKRRE